MSGWLLSWFSPGELHERRAEAIFYPAWQDSHGSHRVTLPVYYHEAWNYLTVVPQKLHGSRDKAPCFAQRKNSYNDVGCRTSLVVQWLRIHLPMQGTQVWSLIWEDPICFRATKPVGHKYWSRSTWEPMLHSKRSHCNEKPMHHNGLQSSLHSRLCSQLEKVHTQEQRFHAAKNKWNKMLGAWK